MQRFHTGGGSFFGCLYSLRFWANTAIAQPSIRRLLLGLFNNPVTRLVLAFPLTLTDALGLGSEMVIVAQSSADGQAREDSGLEMQRP